MICGQMLNFNLLNHNLFIDQMEDPESIGAKIKMKVNILMRGLSSKNVPPVKVI